jgi:predicted ABC-type ATPase
MLLEKEVSYYNPDEATRRILSANPGATLEQANSEARKEGKRLLERAIEERLDFAFETTLGGNTIPALLQKAVGKGIEVRIWFAGLSSPELHMKRVQSPVEAGGLDIPEQKIRERYNKSRTNLIDLMPGLTEQRVYDNSGEADPKRGKGQSPG